MTQGALFPSIHPVDLTKARAARDRALGLAGQHADFMESAALAIRQAAARHATFIVDDVWRYMLGEPTTVDRRAMGAAMVQAVRDGLIEKTDRFVPSAQSQCHANPRRVWRSLVY